VVQTRWEKPLLWAWQGELLGLRWCDLDLAKGTVAVRQTAAMYQGKPTI